MTFEFDSWDIAYKDPFGAVFAGTSVRFRVRSDADSVLILGFGEKIPMEKKGDTFAALVTASEACGPVFYRFEAVFGGQTRFFGRGSDSARAEQDGADYQLSVHRNRQTPDWFRGAVMYQVYTDRFFRGSSKDAAMREKALMHTSWNDRPVYVRNTRGEIVIWDFFGGNLDGVIRKLDYLKSIGVDVVYLNPIFESVSNHKYDTADYTQVDRMYGTNKTLVRLVGEAKKRGMKIMLDGVFSHTGDDSIYFNKYRTYGSGGAYPDKNSKYGDWYHFDSYPDKYACWWGVSALPSVDELCPSFLEFMLDEKNGAVIGWMKLGIAGWRLDVADELPDAFIKKLKQAILKVNPQAVLLGEVWEDASSKVSYGKQRKYILDDSLDSVSNYPLRDALIALLTQGSTAERFGSLVMRTQENYPRDVFLSLMNMTGTHDTMRLLSVLGDAPSAKHMNTWQKRDYRLPEKKEALAKLRLCAFLIVIFTLPGNPCVYYGDEIGLQGYEDPYNRGTFDWTADSAEVGEMLAALARLRRQMDIGSAFVRFSGAGTLLEYTLASPAGSHTVYVNTGERADIKTPAGSRIVFTHRAETSGAGVALEEYGAAVFQLG